VVSIKQLQGNTDEHKYFRNICTIVDEDGQMGMFVPADGTYKIISVEQIEALKKKEYQLRGRQLSFTLSDMENIKEVIANVPEKHCGYLLYLQCFLGFDGVIRNPDKSPMTYDDMMKKLKVGKTVLYEFMDTMKSNNIILVDKKEDAELYRIDSRYHWRGKTNNPRVIKSFTARVKELYDEVNARDLGFLYKLLPYVHQGTNMICVNPYEPNVDKIVALNKSDIARVTGASEKTVYNKMRKLKFGDEYVFAEVRRGNERFYMINPFVFYRKRGVPDPTLRALFLASMRR
jgi:hypothetical protein